MAENTPFRGVTEIFHFFIAIYSGSVEAVEAVKQFLVKNEVDGKKLNDPNDHISPAGKIPALFFIAS